MKRNGILFVMAYHSRREFDQYRRILDHWEELVEMNSPFRILFVDSIGEKIRTHLPHDTIEYADPPGLRRHQCINLKWAFVARHVEEARDCALWFWWEADALPVRRDCFEFFKGLWRGSHRIMGYHVKDDMWGMRHRINGVAFYARDYWSYFQPSYDPAKTFDTCKRFDPRADRAHFAELNRWYGLVFHEKSSRRPFILSPGLRLVHGIKDESLLEHVLGRHRHFPVRSDAYRAVRNRYRWLAANWGLKNIPPPER
jgi:hypothetical protein